MALINELIEEVREFASDVLSLGRENNRALSKVVENTKETTKNEPFSQLATQTATVVSADPVQADLTIPIGPSRGQRWTLKGMTITAGTVDSGLSLNIFGIVYLGDRFLGFCSGQPFATIADFVPFTTPDGSELSVRVILSNASADVEVPVNVHVWGERTYTL